MSDERAKFEAWLSEDGKWPNIGQRDANDNYVFMQTYTAWQVWQAAIAQVSPPADESVQMDARAVFVHKKTGGRYTDLGIVTIQTDTPINDMQSLVLYEGEDGRRWARPLDEFEERFAAMAKGD